MVDDRKAFEQHQQNIILKDRRRLMVSGVRHVESFNEECIILDTENGILIIRELDYISTISTLNHPSWMWRGISVPWNTWTGEYRKDKEASFRGFSDRKAAR